MNTFPSQVLNTLQQVDQKRCPTYSTGQWKLGAENLTPFWLFLFSVFGQPLISVGLFKGDHVTSDHMTKSDRSHVSHLTPICSVHCSSWWDKRALTRKHMLRSPGSDLTTDRVEVEILQRCIVVTHKQYRIRLYNKGLDQMGKDWVR